MQAGEQANLGRKLTYRSSNRQLFRISTFPPLYKPADMDYPLATSYCVINRTDESLTAMRAAVSKLRTIQAFLPEREALRQNQQALVFTNGCFDILHSGHVTYLEFARQQGDALVVGLNSDASVTRAKGPERPIHDAAERALVLGALECVDYIIIFEEDEPAELIGQLIPDILVKGADWAHYVSGRDIVEAHGGKVVLADMVPGKSTTNILATVKGKPNA